MKTILAVLFISIALSACGSAPSDASVAAEYGISVEQYRDIKAAAEGMGMKAEDHFAMMGYTRNKAQ